MPAGGTLGKPRSILCRSDRRGRARGGSRWSATELGVAGETAVDPHAIRGVEDRHQILLLGGLLDATRIQGDLPQKAPELPAGLRAPESEGALEHLVRRDHPGERAELPGPYLDQVEVVDGEPAVHVAPRRQEAGHDVDRGSQQAGRIAKGRVTAQTRIAHQVA